jgi:hypothetical protein
MRGRARKVYLASVIFLALTLLSACASSVHDKGGISAEVTAESFAQHRGTMGVVLLAVNWGRRWKCGGYENAQLFSFSFDRMPLIPRSDEHAADLTVEGPFRVTVRPEFLNYALLVEPGEYALSGFNIKVARSISDVGQWVAKRSELLKDGKAHAGSLRISAGETVYIGNFFLDCGRQPTLWRFYTEGVPSYQSHLAEFKQKYPFLEIDHAIYRLFQTNAIGRSYELK